MSLPVSGLNPNTLTFDIDLQVPTPVIDLGCVHEHVVASNLLEFFNPLAAQGFGIQCRGH
jgi:hypothetical protein